MKHIKTFEDFKPITINSAKPFKVKKGLLKNAVYLQKGIKSDRKRLEKEKDSHKRTKLNNDKNHKINKLRDISFKTIKQAQYLKDNPVKENYLEHSIQQNYSPTFQDFESEDFVIGLPTFISDGHTAQKNFVTNNVGEVVSSSEKMIKIKYGINSNSPENGYILDDKMQLTSFKKYFRFATPEEIEAQNAKNDSIKFNI